ncbi:TetR/AcrR family transcriptional regulator [Amycolatopsis sp. H20-H5]|uniref:TetR/AcrR family transcriptional regulator n=1 Tax=Amycolatopsis sp. H20-H5 TaxID=3046309 RepID=UPI002DBF855B|nr:TetR family transcriptional regulator [Amycolatopsis sp. H20-H5]MEC3981257.1 TetR family transcriptional regulator [Amycolatopsis sp. H20-H5]
MSEALPRKPRRSPGDGERQRDPERTKARIIDAAKAEFGAKGFAAARVGDIADRAGVNKQLISYYFGGKEGLYQEVASGSFRTGRAISDPGSPLAEVVSQFVLSTLADPDLARLFLRENLTEDASGDVGVEAQREFMQQQLEHVRGRQEAGDAPADVDPAYLMVALMGASSAALALPRVVRAITGLEPDSPEFVRKYAEQLARLVAHLGK